MRTKLLNEAADVIVAAQERGLILGDEKVIPFGLQISFNKGDYSIVLNIYSSKKKGISYVIGGSVTNPLRPLLKQVLETVNPSVAFHNFKSWAGTDESGKGDFFGPLVVAGFICNNVTKPELIDLGVRDSKKLSDTQAVRIARKLYQNYPNQIETLVLLPVKYNELYNKFVAQGKKLNQLLAWMHARVILNLRHRHELQGAVVDRFADDKVLKGALADLRGIELVNRPKAEADPAVAAASIIARFHFIQNLASLEKKYSLPLPKGASDTVIKAAQVFAQRWGKPRLSEVAKTHFKTLAEV